ncbi:PfkB family carbohydrate kinase [Planctomycetota bacterium]
MSLLVVGSVAFDSVETPFGCAEESLGGSAVYFSFASSLLVETRLVGVVGTDFKKEYIAWIEEKGIDIRGLLRVPGETFRWSGRYEGDMNSAETVAVNLNVFGKFDPQLPDSYLDSEYIFLANGHPNIQMKVLEQVDNPTLVMADTMNLWIETERNALMELFAKVDGLIINDGEARQLTGEHLTVAAGKRIVEMGPEIVIVKKGEHGALLFYEDDVFAVPSFPVEKVLDPTGAGDSFAGGVMGYLAQQDQIDSTTLKRSLIYGTTMASLNVESFSLNRLREISRQDVARRAQSFIEMLRFE